MSRSPHGERGLKSGLSWSRCAAVLGRSPHGERGLKFKKCGFRWQYAGGRSPHGERGLKYSLYCYCRQYWQHVAPPTGSVD